jgi:hypothetical protein
MSVGRWNHSAADERLPVTDSEDLRDHHRGQGHPASSPICLQSAVVAPPLPTHQPVAHFFVPCLSFVPLAAPVL